MRLCLIDCTIFFKKLHSEIFPEACNNVFIFQMFKSGDRENPNNSCGITLLNCLGK